MSFVLLGILNSQVEAAGGGGFDLLETTVLGTTATDITFSGLGSYSAYKHLQLRVVARSNFNSSVLIGFTIQLNSDTGTNYSYHYLSGNASSVQSASGASVGALDFHDTVSSNTSTASAFGATIIDILDFGNSSKNTTVRGLGGATITGESWISLFSGAWYNTAAVTSLKIIPDAGSFVSDSRFSLYGRS